MLRTIAAAVCALILFSASVSRADEGAAPQPAVAPQPAAAPPPPPPGYGAPPPYYPPPYYLLPAQSPPRVLKWTEGEEIPPGYHKGTQMRVDLVVGGAVTFGAAWLPSAAMAAFSTPVFAVPLAGPFIAMEWARSEGFGGAVKFWLVFDGIQQAGGLAMFIGGLAARRTVLLRSDVKGAKTWWLPTPMSFGKGSAGLGILGRI